MIAFIISIEAEASLLALAKFIYITVQLVDSLFHSPPRGDRQIIIQFVRFFSFIHLLRQVKPIEKSCELNWQGYLLKNVLRLIVGTGALKHKLGTSRSDDGKL